MTTQAPGVMRGTRAEGIRSPGARFGWGLWRIRAEGLGLAGRIRLTYFRTCIPARPK